MWQQLPGPASGPPWPWRALVCPKCPVFPSGRLCPSGRIDECWQPLVLHFLLTAHLSSALALPLMPIWAYMEGGQATSLVCILDGRGLLFLPWWSGTLPAGWWMCLPLGPALGDHACSHGGLTSLLPSAQFQQHA